MRKKKNKTQRLGFLGDDTSNKISSLLSFYKVARPQMFFILIITATLHNSFITEAGKKVR